MPDLTKISSPSRTYVAICNKTNFDGVYCKKFTTPERSPIGIAEENSISFASWYFLNILNHFSCVEKVITFEDYQDLTDQQF